MGKTHNKSEARTRNSERNYANRAAPAHVHPPYAAHKTGLELNHPIQHHSKASMGGYRRRYRRRR